MSEPWWEDSVEHARMFKELGLVVLLQIVIVVLALAVAVGLPFGAWYVFIRKPYPGTLHKMGDFECEDPADEGDIRERKKDFSRIVATRRDLWLFTPKDSAAHCFLPLDVPAELTRENAEQCYQDFKTWIKGELSAIPGGTWESGRSLGGAVVDRVVNITSVSPEFKFLQRFRITPRVMQPKYLLMISSTGQVRVAWYAFVSDSDEPGKRSGPFVVKLVSEDLNCDRMHTWCSFKYSCLRTSKTKMEDVLAGEAARIHEAISHDYWKYYYTDY